MTQNALPIRSALETLQLECPEYRISQRVIGDRLFYVAEAADPGVQPVFAQAETVDRLRAKLRIPEAEFSAEVPSIARVYDVLLGGKNNFAADRIQAEQGSGGLPARRRAGRPGPAVPGPRRHLRRPAGHPASSWTSAAGCRPRRTPTRPRRPFAPDARVVYVDNDAQVLSHARNLLAKSPRRAGRGRGPDLPGGDPVRLADPAVP